MDLLGITQIGTLALATWLFISVAALPRFIDKTGWVIVITLIVGFFILWGFNFIAPQPAFNTEVSSLVITVSALFAGLSREVLERRRTGRWRFLDREK